VRLVDRITDRLAEPMSSARSPSEPVALEQHTQPPGARWIAEHRRHVEAAAPAGELEPLVAR